MTAFAPLFTWRSAICESELPPTDRHVALTLSLHMNERGGSCFPAQATVARETGLNDQTIKKVLRRLTDSGWLNRSMTRRGEGRGTRVEYVATIPSTGIENTGAQTTTGRDETRPPVATTPVSNSPVSTSEEEEPPIAPQALSLVLANEAEQHDPFDDFWSLYPRKVDKQKARTQYALALRKAPAETIFAGLRRWLAYWDIRNEPGFIKHPDSWLRNERWESEPPPTPVRRGHRTTAASEMEGFLAAHRQQSGPPSATVIDVNESPTLRALP